MVNIIITAAGNVTGAVQLLRRHQTTVQLTVTMTTTTPATNTTTTGQDKKRLVNTRRILS